MPEGHTIHRLANAFNELYAGEPLTVTSPQGRFADGARLLDGMVMRGAQAWGKQMFLEFGGQGVAGGQGLPGAHGAAGASSVADADGRDARWLRVHLGLYGSWTFTGDGTVAVTHAIGAPRRRITEAESDLPAAGSFPPEPRGQVRVRLLGEHAAADLTGPTACEVITDQERLAVIGRLGPDPIRADGDSDRFAERLARTRTPIAAALMNQSVIAGVGNIYRAESLFRAKLAPMTPARDVPATRVRTLWDDLVGLMREGVRTGRIVTTYPEDRDSAAEAGATRPGDRRRARQNTDADPGAVPADEAFYVYQRDGLPCRICGTPIAMRELAGRKLYWCPTCQRGGEQ